MLYEVSCDCAGRPLRIETGRMARQAEAAVLVTYGETMILVAATVSPQPMDLPFLPLRADFEEKMYAVGQIPGGFFKREGRPGEGAILSCRRIDRPIRTLLPSGLRNDVQIIATPLSADNESSVDVVAMIGASAAMHLSSLPFGGPFGVVQVGMQDGEFILNPSFEQVEAGDLDLLMAATAKGVVMAEAQGREIPEDKLVEAFQLAEEACQPVVAAIEELREQAGKPKRDYPLWEPRAEIVEFVANEYSEPLSAAFQVLDKQERQDQVAAVKDEIAARVTENYEDPKKDIEAAVDEITKRLLKQAVLHEQRRLDGRSFAEVRPISCEVGIAPRAHGSGLFTRGETQVLTLTTLGAVRDQQMVRSLAEEEYHRFMHHYNFPPFSVGEVRPLRGPARREIGHGALAHRALENMLPPEEECPYTIRLVSEVLESNGSSSMAAVCGSTLALMDAGMQITAPVAGIAIGLVYESEQNYAVLTDIQGLEDHAGSMDLKVAGTRVGVNALQLDMTVPGLPTHILAEGLQQAREARLHILDVMGQAIAYPRAELSKYAPRMFAVKIKVDQIGMIIGPGGKNIRKMEEEYEVDIDIDDDGTVLVFGENSEKAEQARDQIREMTREIEVGEIITGKVVSTPEFGAFVELSPGRDGLLHISEMAHEHVRSVGDVVKIGDEVKVKVTAIDSEGKIRLSRKVLLPAPAGGRPSSSPGGGRSNDSRRNNDRSGGRGRSHDRSKE